MKVKKLLSLVLAAGILVGATACGPVVPGGEKVDSSKTQLNVSSYGGGYGSEWLYAVKERFEKEFADEHFEEGKTGVQIIIDDAKNNGEALLNTNVKSSSTHVFFNEVVNYDTYISQGIALDITDAIKEKLPGENKSVYDKLTDSQKKYLARNDKYYMVPHYNGYIGITIDEDLFNEKSLFMSEDGKFNKKSTDSGLSKGPDGKANTYDDGFPATFEEFYKLMDTMKSRNVMPLVWSADNQFYVTRMAEALAADVNGAENTEKGYAFSGTLDNLVKSVNPDGSVVYDSAELNDDNGYEVVRQDGYYRSLQFVEKIIRGEYFHKEYSFDGGTNTDTQRRYLQSNSDQALSASDKNKPIAMLVDGCYWESEATGVFKEMEAQNTADKKYGKSERNFRFLPFPKATEDKVGTGSTLLEIQRAYGFINANLSNNEAIKNLAIKFLQYCNTDVSLSEFTRITSATKGLIYEVSEKDLAECTTFCKSVLAYERAEDTKVVYALSDNMNFRTHTSDFILGKRYSTNDGNNPSKIFKDNASMTALSYFNAMRDYASQNWTKN